MSCRPTGWRDSCPRRPRPSRRRRTRVARHPVVARARVGDQMDRDVRVQRELAQPHVTMFAQAEKSASRPRTRMVPRAPRDSVLHCASVGSETTGRPARRASRKTASRPPRDAHGRLPRAVHRPTRDPELVPCIGSTRLSCPGRSTGTVRSSPHMPHPERRPHRHSCRGCSSTRRPRRPSRTRRPECAPDRARHRREIQIPAPLARLALNGRPASPAAGAGCAASRPCASIDRS